MALVTLIKMLVLKAKLLELPLYEPLFLNDMAPIDRYQRRKWLAELAFPSPSCCIIKYSYGNNLGTLVYAWKIPIDGPVDATIIGQVQQSFSTGVGGTGVR